MFGKFMNNFYYGKSGKGDYRKEDMPTTRWALFWEMLKIRFSGLVRLNLMYVVAWLPALIVAGYTILSMYSGLVTLTELQTSAAAGEATAAELTNYQSIFAEGVKALLLRGLLFLIPCIAITGPCTAGVSYVTRNWARDEHAFIWSDFKDALKENWKQALAISSITGFVPIILYVCWAFYGQMTSTSMLYLIPQVLSLTVGLLWLMSLMYTYPLMVTYKLTFRELLRNSLILTVGRLPMTAGLKLLSLVPTAIAVAVAYLTPYLQWAVLGYFAYYLIIGYSLSRFVYASYSNAAFDRFINPNIEGATVNQGLYVEEDDDEPEADASAEIPPVDDSFPVETYPPKLPRDDQE